MNAMFDGIGIKRENLSKSHLLLLLHSPYFAIPNQTIPLLQHKLNQILKANQIRRSCNPLGLSFEIGGTMDYSN